MHQAFLTAQQVCVGPKNIGRSSPSDQYLSERARLYQLPEAMHGMFTQRSLSTVNALLDQDVLCGLRSVYYQVIYPRAHGFKFVRPSQTREKILR